MSSSKGANPANTDNKKVSNGENDIVGVGFLKENKAGCEGSEAHICREGTDKQE